ncbi:unnamed protein product [Nezara viridula]|uniref:Lipase domain-containing protein n=1 Tax=Nezara viridula TaxID=85310 RepID=A0A9P0MXJ0_NEZVI|nr:unnamed protein product [Nezara viridula]
MIQSLLTFILLLVQVFDSHEAVPHPHHHWGMYKNLKGNMVYVNFENANSPTKELEVIDVDKVQFHLYTKKNPKVSQRLYLNDSSALNSSNYVHEDETKFIVHGFLNDINSETIQNIKNNLLDHSSEGYNIIGVDWSYYTMIYTNVLYKSEGVGNIIGKLVDFLVEKGSKLENIHLIGHSLGAQACGFAGASLKTGRVARISGLDPALPGFDDADPDKRLDGQDALFVDCIHTCGGNLGIFDPICTADYYPNGGQEQPGCSWFDFELLEQEEVNVILVDWSEISKGIDYISIAKRTVDVGTYVAWFMDFLVRNGARLDDFHLIGHSLGAHVAGFAGAAVSNGTVARITDNYAASFHRVPCSEWLFYVSTINHERLITLVYHQGLDPAMPGFNQVPSDKRLDRSNAKFVDCIHTCAGMLGLTEAICTADFYPNGGRNMQPGCPFYDFGRCSHKRSHNYFTESIDPNYKFPALQCESLPDDAKYPSSCSPSSVNMGYYTLREGSDIKQELIPNDVSVLQSSYFDPKHPTKVLIHGFLSSSNKPMVQEIKNALLEQEDVNVIAVDWSKISFGIDYNRIAKKTVDVGAYTAELINFLVENGAKPNDFHLIGHSLGAHIAGFAGASIKKGKVARITGLDPAKPGFHNVPIEKRLNTNNAKYVDCIHTCVGTLGLTEAICTTDFYPNGGKNMQPGCPFFDFGRCSHIRSYEYFAESINPEHKFMAERCPSLPVHSHSGCTSSPIEMGYYISPSVNGIFYGKTNNRSPFATIIKRK